MDIVTEGLGDAASRHWALTVCHEPKEGHTWKQRKGHGTLVAYEASRAATVAVRDFHQRHARLTAQKSLGESWSRSWREQAFRFCRITRAGTSPCGLPRICGCWKLVVKSAGRPLREPFFGLCTRVHGLGSESIRSEDDRHYDALSWHEYSLSTLPAAHRGYVLCTISLTR